MAVSEMQVQKMNISSTEWGNNFTYPWVINKGGGQRHSSGVTSRVARIIAAVASSGDILPFNAPESLVNGSYTIDATIPTVKCEKASPAAKTNIIQAVTTPKRPLDQDLNFEYCDSRDSSLCTVGAVGYVAIAGSEASSNASHGNVTYDFVGESAYSKSYLGSILVAIGKPTVEVVQCVLQNSSVEITIEARGSVPHVAQVQRHTMTLNATGSPNHQNWAYDSYSCFFQEISKYILGYIERTTVRGYPSFDFVGRTKETNLALSRQWYNTIQNISTGVLAEGLIPPEPLVRNTTFAEDIEGFALNASLSLLNDPTLCETVLANVTSTSTSTVYVYKPSNLLIAYGTAIALSAASSLVGAYAFYVNGKSYDNKPTNFGMAMQNPGITEVLREVRATDERSARRKIEGTKIRLDPIEGFVVRSRRRDR